MLVHNQPGLVDEAQQRNNESDDFELAYFTNSYPQDSDTTKTIIKVIKIVTIISILCEACFAGNLATGLIQYSEIATKMDIVLQVGSVAYFISAVGRIISAIQAHNYVKQRTDRTPENKINLSKFFWIVTIGSTLVTVTCLHLIEKHRTESAAYASLKGMRNNHASGISEVSVFDKMEEFVEDTKSKLVILTVFHLITHYLLHRLNKKESQLPRIVDLKAFRSKIE